MATTGRRPLQSQDLSDTSAARLAQVVPETPEAQDTEQSNRSKPYLLMSSIHAELRYLFSLKFLDSASRIRY